MKNNYLKIAIAAFWLVMVAWLVRYEAFPEYFTHSLDGYKGLLSRDILLMDSWMKISCKGAPIGYSHTSLDSGDSTAETHCTINNRTDLKIKFMGKSRNLTVNSSAGLDTMYSLRKFSCSLTMADIAVDISGERRNDRAFDVVIKHPAGTERMAIDVPDDAILFSPISAQGMKNLKVGHEIRIRAVDPMTMKKTDIVVKAIRNENLTIGGKEYKSTVLASDYHGLRLLAWVDPSGNVLRQETPLGWVMEKCSADEAYAALKNSDGGEDFLTSLLPQFFSLSL